MLLNGLLIYLRWELVGRSHGESKTSHDLANSTVGVSLSQNESGAYII